MSSGESDLAGDQLRPARGGPSSVGKAKAAPWLIAFTALVFVASTAPGLAATAVEGSSLPTEAQLTEAIAEEEAAEAGRDEWLAGSQATSEREASEYAYTELNAAEEEELLRSSFASQLERLESDPARLLSQVQLDQVFSQSEAQVTLEGEKMLLESSIPIRVPEEEGQLQKVDLGLDEVEGGYEPANPVVDVSLPETADGPVSIGEDGLSISLEDANPTSEARTFDGEDLFLPEARQDASLLLSPVAGGVDVSTLLSSRESPEQLRFAVALPGQATLRASENGGAEILSGTGNLLADVNPPHAVDAQGTEVEATLSVEGESLVVDVPHRSMDIAYPILVDPEVVENWSGWSDPAALGYWKWQWAGVAEKDYIGQTSCIITCWGNGLYVRSRSSFTYPAGSYGRWWFTAQGSTTYMRRVALGPMNFDAHGCTANEPHAYTGVWNDGGWWSVLANAYPSGWFSYVDTGEQNLGQGTRTAFVGIGAASNSNIKCGRDYALGGATLYLTDPEAPTVTSVTGLPPGWVKGNTQITAGVTASDPGLGVQKIRALGGPAGEWWWDQPSCAGTMKDRCGATRSGQISFNTNGLFEGKKTVSFQPFDPVGNGNNSKSYEVWVDRLPPTIDLKGQLAKATNEEGEKEVPAGEGDDLSLPTYNLEVEASDATSGAKSIEFFLDESKTPEAAEAPKCSAGKCSLTYQLKLTGLKAGSHTLHVVVADQAGNTAERKVEFEYTPATGIKDEYVMQHIPLPDGLDHSEETEPHGPEIAVNVVNGNVVYHERDLQVEGRDANLELERSYNSQLPAEKDTRWGHGWSVAQLPELQSQPSESPPAEATMLRATGAMTSAVSIPTSTSQSPTFEPKLHASVAKTAAGYRVSYEDSQEENVFDPEGELEETAYPSGASLQIDYKGEYKYVTPTYSSAFGQAGTGAGELDAPGGLAFDSNGDVFVLDQGNNRVEKFNSKGVFLSKFGEYGSGKGQLHMPSAIAIDSENNLWIADTENSRIEKFGPDGKYLSQFGSEGKANGQLGRPEGIAIDPKGNIWVADTYNSRIQEFTSAGTFVKSIGSYGTGVGQFYNPTGIDFGANETLWITDWSNNRVTELNSSGSVLREFGTAGSGPGQFDRPDVIEADGRGRVWVGDERNDRVEVFSESNGVYITQFGAPGALAGQFRFAFPMGIAENGKGRLWIADSGNDRIQKWTVGEFLHGAELTGMTVEEPDPWADTDISAEINTVKGLVESVDVEGSAAESDYSYESGLLTAEQDEEGKASYGYDSSKRLNHVELPNGTTASIEYDALSRATAVTVDPAGEEGAKTTKFTYVDEPRETRVSGGGNPEVIYGIGNDGSVFKWSYAKEPPKFASFGGTLWEHRNSTTALTAGDQSLTATAESAQQIAEIQVLINGEVIAEEKTCVDDPKTEQHECQQPTLEWVTNTANHPAGQLNLEVVATDFLGQAVAERFFVTIPRSPEIAPEAPVEPTFEEVKSFRNEFGLDYESGRSESQINQLIWELLEEWKLEKPIARWSAEEWGVPLREAEIKELEYRAEYIDTDGPLIEAWGSANAPLTYGGYQVDNQHGGQIRIGFTENQGQLVSALRQQLGLIAADRIVEFPIPPTHSLQSLVATQSAVINEDTKSPALSELTTEVRIDDASSTVVVGAEDIARVKSLLTSALGEVPITVEYDPGGPEVTGGRYRAKGRIRAGDAIWLESKPRCTAGFGAHERAGTKQNGQAKRRDFLLTAGHCYSVGQIAKRGPAANSAPSELNRIGTAKRNALTLKDEYETDAEAVRLDTEMLIPKQIFLNGAKPLPVHQPAKVMLKSIVCFSGISTKHTKCGEVVFFSFVRLKSKEFRHGLQLDFAINRPSIEGDSGSPVWLKGTGQAVGLVSASDKSHAFIAPLVQPEAENLDTSSIAPGALKALEDGDTSSPMELQVGN